MPRKDDIDLIPVIAVAAKPETRELTQTVMPQQLAQSGRKPRMDEVERTRTFGCLGKKVEMIRGVVHCVVCRQPTQGVIALHVRFGIAIVEVQAPLDFFAGAGQPYSLDYRMRRS